MKVRRQKHGEGNSASGFSPISRRDGNGAGRALICTLVVIFVLAFLSPARAQNEVSSEYRVKLAFLYNFAQFVQWPADTFSDSGAPLIICVAGDNPFVGEIALSLQGRSVGGHPIELRRLRPQEDPHKCHMVFLRAAGTKTAAKIFAESRGSSTLTVGEAAGFAARGGMINLTREQDKLRFEVNIDATGETRLRISSKLLSLAKIVKN